MKMSMTFFIEIENPAGRQGPGPFLDTASIFIGTKTGTHNNRQLAKNPELGKVVQACELGIFKGVEQDDQKFKFSNN